MDGTPQVQVGTRETQQATNNVNFSAATGVTASGLAPLYQSGRYVRFRMTQPAGATWANAQGIDDIDARPMGMQ